MHWNMFRAIRTQNQPYSGWSSKLFARALSLAVSALLIVVLIPACHQVKYSDTEIKGIRKVERVGLGGKSRIYFQMYDKELGKYYEAEQGGDGKWYFTKDGDFLRDLNRNQVDGS